MKMHDLANVKAIQSFMTAKG